MLGGEQFFISNSHSVKQERHPNILTRSARGRKKNLALSDEAKEKVKKAAYGKEEINGRAEGAISKRWEPGDFGSPDSKKKDERWGELPRSRLRKTWSLISLRRGLGAYTLVLRINKVNQNQM